MSSGRQDWFSLWLELESEALAEAARRWREGVSAKEVARLRVLYKRAVEALEELGRFALSSEGGNLEGIAVWGAADLAVFAFLAALFQAAALKLRGLEEKPAVSRAIRSYFTSEAIEEYLVSLHAQEKIERGGGNG
jgi:hypothetical protein